MYPITSQVDLELILNKLSLSVIDNKIIQLWGFCGLNEQMKFKSNPPEYKKGSLKVEHNLKQGFAYSINDEELPVYVNVETGWVCIGNPSDYENDNAVEFISNCIAVINNNNFSSLWLRPQSLPNLSDSN